VSRPIVKKLGVPFALAYLLAGWLAAALHSHGTHVHAEEVAAAASACSCGHHHCEPQPSHETEGTPDEPEQHDDHHCVVCDNLAKPPLPVAAVELDAAIEPVAEAAEPTAPLSEIHVALAWYSRGPPRV
jgi:hypothetical protein